jgi:hypothetical protein
MENYPGKEIMSSSSNPFLQYHEVSGKAYYLLPCFLVGSFASRRGVVQDFYDEPFS